eukprot:3331727-Prymnesium_polylepis.1
MRSAANWGRRAPASSSVCLTLSEKARERPPYLPPPTPYRPDHLSSATDYYCDGGAGEIDYYDYSNQWKGHHMFNSSQICVGISG